MCALLIGGSTQDSPKCYETSPRYDYSSGGHLNAYYLYLYSIYNGGTEKNLTTDLDKGVDFVNGSVIGGILWVIMLAMLYLNLSNPITIVFIASVIYSLIIFLQVRGIKM